MKTIRIFTLLFLSLALVFTACDERDYDVPPFVVPEYEGEANITIKELKEKYAGQSLVEITEKLIIGGIVTANDVSGNIYKQIQLQDSTAGICIAINQTGIYGSLRVGQEVFIELQGLYFGLYGGYPQIGYRYSANNDENYTIGQCPWLIFKDHYFLHGLPNANRIEIPEYNVEDLTTAEVGTVVKVKNVYFENGGVDKFAVVKADGSVQTESKNLISTKNGATLTARNSSAANFAHFTMPEGVGSVTGVLSIYNSTMQITFRDSLDCSYTRFNTGDGIGTKDLPWKIPYVLDSQTGEEGWIEGYIVGTVGPSINATNPITKNEDICWESPFLNLTVVLAASKEERNWKNVVVVNLPAESDIRNSVNLIDNAANLGKTLKVKGKLSNQYEVAGLVVGSGTSAEFELEGSGAEAGSGTKEDPYSVTEGKKRQSTGASAWVKGYIVGSVKSGVTSIASAADVYIGVSSGWDAFTNVIIADDINETDYTKCIIVNLPAGTPLRSSVNLPDNPGNYKKELLVYGVLRTYFGQAGLRDSGGTADDYVLSGEGSEPEPGGDLILDVSFTNNSMGGFTSYNVSGAQEWFLNATSSYGVNMSGFADNKSNANEDWLISPAMNLTEATQATLTFEHAINKGDVNNLKTNHTLWISTDYNSGAPSSASWTQVTITTYPTGLDWTFVSSGNINLPSSVIGQSNVRIAFKYLCSDNESATWEIKNLKVSGDAGSTDPTDPTDPGDETGSSSDNPYSVAQAMSNQGKTGDPAIWTWTKGYIVGCVVNGTTSVGSAADVIIGVTSGWDSATNILIADSENEKDYRKCVVVNLPAGKDLRTLVNLVDNPGNYKKSITVKGVLRTYFGLPGLRDSAGASADFILK